MRKLAVLFFELFRIALFVIGGGYAIIAVAERTFSRKGWTREGELIEHLPVFQMIPGLIATHTAVYVGNKVAGAPGAVVGVVAVALPSVVIFTFVAVCYRELPLASPFVASVFVGLRSALAGVIAATVIRSLRRSLPDMFAYAVALTALALITAGASVASVLVAAMAAGLVREAARGFGARRVSCSLLPLCLFAKYGLLCFGGGFVLVPMYLEDFVGASAPYLQLPAGEFSNVLALTQMTPGPIGVNGATFFGYHLAGFAGAAAASALLLLPGSLLALLAFRALDRFRTSAIVRGVLAGARPASIALMLVALWEFAGMCVWDVTAAPHLSWCTLTRFNFNPVALTLLAFTVVASWRKWLGPVALVFVCAAVTLALRA